MWLCCLTEGQRSTGSESLTETSIVIINEIKELWTCVLWFHMKMIIWTETVQSVHLSHKNHVKLKTKQMNAGSLIQDLLEHTDWSAATNNTNGGWPQQSQRKQAHLELAFHCQMLFFQRRAGRLGRVEFFRRCRNYRHSNWLLTLKTEGSLPEQDMDLLIVGNLR